MLAVVGCGSDEGRAPATGGGVVPPGPTDTTCATPAPDCPCPTVGATATCRVNRVSGKYVSCSEGTLHCGPDGRWGLCEGAATVWDPAIDAGLHD